MPATINLPPNVPPECIGLSTGGAVVDRVEPRQKDAPHLRVTGRVLPLDPAAQPITFRLLLPQEGWNGRLLHIGGGGFDGVLPFMGANGVGAEMWHGRPNPVAQGYAVVGSDSGHTAPQPDFTNWADPHAADFSLNDEMLANFAHEHIAKVHDVAVELVQAAYGEAPWHSYFVGTSNGGRCAFLAAQRYPERFDGVIAGYPAIHWVPMALFGSHVADVETALGEEGFIGPDDWRRAYRIIGEGIAEGNPTHTRARLIADLRPSQLRLIDTCAAALDVSFLGSDEFETYPGLAVMRGEPLRDDDAAFVMSGLSSAPGARDGAPAAFGDAVISRQVMRDASFDARGFDPSAHVEELRRASSLLDAGSTDLDAFVARGGKMLLYHGTYDQLISVESTERYMDALVERYEREQVCAFAKLYVVEGMGHSVGRFDMGADLLGALDAWVSEGDAPGDLVATERNETHEMREQLLVEYPYIARYVSGDPALASSYERALPGTASASRGGVA